MSRSIHARLDQASARALDLLRATGLTTAESVRTALVEAAAHRQARLGLRDEVSFVASNANDRAEMAAVRAEVAELTSTRF